MTVFKGAFFSFFLFFISTSVWGEKNIFLSTQAYPLAEAQAFRDYVLGDYSDKKLRFITQSHEDFYHSVINAAQQEETSLELLGSTHSTLWKLRNDLIPLDHLKQDLHIQKISPAFMQEGTLGTSEQLYIPWMLASYIMVANRQALTYLPEGANINHLSYEEFSVWGQNLVQATNQKKIGFAGGHKGLMHRFLQGYLYPSYTGAVVQAFDSEEAVDMWSFFKTFWEESVNPRSLHYDATDTPLLSGEIWIGFDHIARLKEPLSRPDNFVAFPAPYGPKGRGTLSIIAGLAIPKNTKNPKESENLISYLSSWETQIKTLEAIGFFPIVQLEDNDDLPLFAQRSAAVIQYQLEDSLSLQSKLPLGLNEKETDFHSVYTETFKDIVLKESPIKATLAKYVIILNEVLEDTTLPCTKKPHAPFALCPLKKETQTKTTEKAPHLGQIPPKKP